jgi:hypothetical protein
MTQPPDPRGVLAIRLAANESGAETIRDYLCELLRRLWAEGSEFSAKRPFGDSDWQWCVADALVREGLVTGQRDQDGDLYEVDWTVIDRLMSAAIRVMCEEHQ